MQILRFKTNVVEEIALENSEGRLVEGRFEDLVMYSLTDGRIVYVKPIVAQKINERKTG